jgi:hypothetical protein
MAKKEAKLDETTFAAQLGYAASFFYQDAELKALLKQAVKESWTTDKFKGKFMATKWYRSHSENERRFSELEKRDPATVSAEIAAQKAKLSDQFTQAGIKIDDARLNQIARLTLMYGSSPEQVQDMIAAEFKYTPGDTAGAVADTEMQVRSLARDYGVDFNDQQMSEWIGGVISGEYTIQSLQDFARDSARSKYMGYQKQIDAGMTVRDIASPYLSSYARVLETDPQNVDLNNPLLQKALQGSMDKQGQVVPQTVYEFEKTLRRDPRWLKTQNARDSMTNLALRIGQDFGLVG